MKVLESTFIPNIDHERSQSNISVHQHDQ